MSKIPEADPHSPNPEGPPSPEPTLGNLWDATMSMWNQYLITLELDIVATLGKTRDSLATDPQSLPNLAIPLEPETAQTLQAALSPNNRQTVFEVLTLLTQTLEATLQSPTVLNHSHPEVATSLTQQQQLWAQFREKANDVDDQDDIDQLQAMLHQLQLTQQLLTLFQDVQTDQPNPWDQLANRLNQLVAINDQMGHLQGAYCHRRLTAKELTRLKTSLGLNSHHNGSYADQLTQAMTEPEAIRFINRLPEDLKPLAPKDEVHLVLSEAKPTMRLRELINRLGFSDADTQRLLIDTDIIHPFAEGKHDHVSHADLEHAYIALLTRRLIRLQRPGKTQVPLKLYRDQTNRHIEQYHQNPTPQSVDA